jgi:hypothetical protein
VQRATPFAGAWGVPTYFLFILTAVGGESRLARNYQVESLNKLVILANKEGVGEWSDYTMLVA